MRLPRDMRPERLIQALRKLGYEPVRQSGSHVRIRTLQNGEHHETVRAHHPMKVGALNAILKNIAQHHEMTREALLELLDL